MHQIIPYTLWLAGWLATFGAYAQDDSLLLDDLAYVLEDTTNRGEVLAAMGQLRSNTQVGLAIAAVFEKSPYAPGSRQHLTEWLARQTQGITLLITVAARTKAFRQCELRVSEAVEAWLPLEDRQQIQRGLLEFYFRGSPIPTNAYTSGLLAGIAAMEKKILESKEKGVDIEQEKLPTLVEITEIDEEFSAGIKDYSGNVLNVSYAMKEHETYDLKVAKFRVYNVQDSLVYDSEKDGNRIPIREEGQFTWDGKMNVGANDSKFIRYSDSPFRVKIMASTNALYEDVFEADTTASVDEDADKWNGFKFKDADNFVDINSSYWNFQKFKSYKQKYIQATRFMGISEHPIDYLNENLVSGVYFLGRGPFTLNIRFAYMLKLAELRMGRGVNGSADSDSYKQLVNWFGSASVNGPSMKPLTSTVSNHALGFALDINAVKNPMISDKFLYLLIEIVTGYNLYNNSSSVSEMKIAHNIFKMRLNINDTDRNNDISLDSLTYAYSKINNYIESRRTDSLRRFSYTLTNLSDNKIGKDISRINRSLESIKSKNFNGTRKQALNLCKIALEDHELIKAEIDSFQSIIKYYKNGLFVNYHKSSELNALMSYLQYMSSLVDRNQIWIKELNEYIKAHLVSQWVHNNIINIYGKSESVDTSYDTEPIKSLSQYVSGIVTKVKLANSEVTDLAKFGVALQDIITNSGDVRGKFILDHGFFELKKNFVLKWLESTEKYTYWGGSYPRLHDWMHIEVHPLFNNKAQRRLHEDIDIAIIKEYYQQNFKDEYEKLFNK